MHDAFFCSSESSSGSSSKFSIQLAGVMERNNYSIAVVRGAVTEQKSSDRNTKIDAKFYNKPTRIGKRTATTTNKYKMTMTNAS